MANNRAVIIWKSTVCKITHNELTFSVLSMFINRITSKCRGTDDHKSRNNREEFPVRF
jgi:hypothetical protein